MLQIPIITFHSLRAAVGTSVTLQVMTELMPPGGVDCCVNWIQTVPLILKNWLLNCA